jgi:pSer/pThr/pTyr-binding forkhead associated (FHA) protein
MPKLIISGVTHELVEKAITIGRAADNAIVISDPSISMYHAQLVLEGDIYRLKELGSTNGTYVNGNRVTETLLRFGDQIRFGTAEARYESSDASGLKPLPKTEKIESQFAADTIRPPDFSSAPPFRRPEQPQDPVGTGIMVGLGIVLLVFLGSMIAVLMMHAPGL